MKPGQTVYLGFSTDFLIREADPWRGECWDMIRERRDLNFIFLTKRIERFMECIPGDWADGYDNVTIGCTVENQALADTRLPLFLSYPMKHRFIACAPLLEAIDLTPYLHGVDHVTVGGETGRAARECDYEWVLNIREQCVSAGATFWFKNTGSLFRHDGIVEKINPYKQTGMAKELGIDISDGKRLF